MSANAFRQIRPVQILQARVMVCAVALACASAAWAQAPAAPHPAPGAAAAAPAAPVLTRAQVDALLATPDKVLFLDVRRPDEISTIGGFPAYLNIQLADLDKGLAYIPRDRQIVTVSNHAARAGRAAATLAGRGFKVVGAVGAQTYAAEGGQLTLVKAPPPASAGPAGAPGPTAAR